MLVGARAYEHRIVLPVSLFANPGASVWISNREPQIIGRLIDIQDNNKSESALRVIPVLFNTYTGHSEPAFLKLRVDAHDIFY